MAAWPPASTGATKSTGAFDPTVGGLLETGGFDREYRTGATVSSGLDPSAPTSFRDVHLDPSASTVTIDRPLQLDLGALAMGRRATTARTTARRNAEALRGPSVPYTVAMLLRVVRLTIVGAALLLTLHLFMLIGHGQVGHGPMPPPGGVPHAAVAMDQQPHPLLDLDTSPRAGVDMAATCFAILAGLLLLGAGARRIIRTPRLTTSARASGGAAARRVRPRARSPVELCVSRS